MAAGGLAAPRAVERLLLALAEVALAEVALAEVALAEVALAEVALAIGAESAHRCSSTTRHLLDR